MCGCLGLERYFAEEAKKEALNHYYNKGAVSMDIEVAKLRGNKTLAASQAVYLHTRSKEGVYNLNINDNVRLTEALIKIMQAEVSLTDFFHDRAFSCLFKLLLKASTDASRQEWFAKMRTELHKLMNLADVKLVEHYWQELKQMMQGHDSSKLLFDKLGLLDLMTHQV